MTKEELKRQQEDRVLASYNAVNEYTREDLLDAITWATKTLTDLEGSGHQFYVTADKDGLVCCSFAKVEWNADHCGRGMDHGAQAIVMAVCEYINGA